MMVCVKLSTAPSLDNQYQQHDNMDGEEIQITQKRKRKQSEQDKTRPELKKQKKGKKDTDNDLAMLIKQVYTKNQGSVVAKRNTNKTSKIRRSKNSSVQKLKKDDNHQEIFDKENKSKEKHANDLDYSKDDTFDENKKPYEEIKQKDDDATDQTNQVIAGQDDNNSKPCEITGDESDYSASTSADSSVHRKLNSAKIEEDSAKKEEHEKNLSKITAEIMEQFFKQSDITEPLETFASCWLWDFAGQKDFYATHQAFLSSCAIYVLVADSLEFSTTPDLWLDFEKSADYARFWCDAIHCYRSITTNKEELNPAIIIVQTNKDSHKVKPKTEDSHKVFKKNIGNVFANQDQKKHIRKIYHISNTEDDDKVFEEIRQFISNLAMDMSWGSDIPLKWLLFQQVIEKLKENSVPVDSTENILHIANQDDIGIKDETEFRECLQYFHEIGTIIFFDEVGLNESIILDPQWLVEAFKCLVSDKFENTITISNDWNMLRETGKLSDTLLCKLLKKDTFYQTHFLDNKSHLIAVMKKFDIIVNMKNSEDLYMPCMMEDCSLEMVTRKFIDESSNIDKTSWLCLTFDFLPPVFFNHIIAKYMKKYDISVKTNEIDRSRRHELYRQVAVFKLTETGCEQLVMCTAPHIIAIQIWYSSGEHKKIYSECRQNLCKMVQSLKTRYRLNIEQSIEFVCKNGHFTLDRTSWKELNGSKYRCQQHKSDHFSLGLVDCWYTEDEMDIERQNLDNDGSDLNFKTVKRKIVKRNRRMRFVGAIHIGASSSLYAYSDIQSNESSMDRTKIKLNKYWCKSRGSNLCSMNTTTSILLRNGNEYVDFGFDAEEKYNNLDTSKIYNYNLLNKFTTQLNHKQKISEDFQIRDVKGNNVQASIVFSQMINKLKERLENEVKCDDGKFNPTQMQWVLPIPSTWIDSRAEDFIRTCAKQAGINGDQLILITETEAAVAYLDNSQNYVFRDNRLPTKYLYIDLGDTSYNFTLVETLSKGNIKEVCYLPNKNDSTMGIHMKLFSCFKEIVGSVVLKNLKESSYLKIIEEFENIDTSKENKNIILKIPEKEINDLCIEFHKKNFSQLIEESEYVHAITARSGRLVIKVSFFNMLLKDVAFWITQTVSKVLRKDGDIRTFIVVGGISITRIIRTKLKDNFKTVNIIFLTDYDTTSVVKGAVLYGQGLVT